MPKTTEPTDSEQFSVSLPREAIRVMMLLKGKGLYGTTRGAIARTLIAFHAAHGRPYEVPPGIEGPLRKALEDKIAECQAALTALEAET